jgi:hypothetical protein
MSEPSTEQVERGVAALLPFVDAWNLSLNPEDLGELAWAVLKHSDGDTSFEEIQAAVRTQLAEIAQARSRLYRDKPAE